MNKICTDIEQSKKLIELGIDIKTADMRIGNYIGKSDKVDGTNVHYYTKEESFGAPEIIPCWSFSTLIELMPRLEHYDYPILVKTSIGGYGNGVAMIRYFISYTDGINPIETKKYRYPVDAAYDMIIWLKEHKKL